MSQPETPTREEAKAQQRIAEIEWAAADRAYDAGWGVSEWPAFLTDDERAEIERLTPTPAKPQPETLGGYWE